MSSITNLLILVMIMREAADNYLNEVMIAGLMDRYVKMYTWIIEIVSKPTLPFGYFSSLH